MKLLDIVKKVGTGLIKEIPGAGAIIGVVNEFLPDDKKLPESATGNQVKAAIDLLPPDVAAQVMMKEIDIEIEEIRSFTSVQEALADADRAGSSTRPWIAKLMSIAVFISIMVFMAAWASSIFTNDNETLKTLADSWEIMLAVLATPTALLRSYFGMRTQEKKARYSAAHGQPISPITQLIGSFRR